jgi:hypothetical protein
LTNHIWIWDSGACCPYCNNEEGLYNVKAINEDIVVGNGKTMRATMIGNLKRKVIQLDETTKVTVIHDVKYVPELYANLFSVNKALKKGFKISEAIKVSKNQVSVTFDRIYCTKGDDGFKMELINQPLANYANNDVWIDKSIDVNKFNEILGHGGAD